MFAKIIKIFDTAKVFAFEVAKNCPNAIGFRPKAYII